MQDIPTLVMLYPSEEEEVYDVINGIETSFSFLCSGNTAWETGIGLIITTHIVQDNIL